MDNLPLQLADLTDNREKVDFLNAKARLLMQDSPRNLPRAIALCEMASELAAADEYADQPYQAGLVQSLQNLGEFYIQFANYDLALSFLFKAVNALESVQDEPAKATILNRIGVTYGYLGEYGEALDYYLTAADLYENQGQRLDQAGVLNNIGQVYLHLGEPDRAQGYLESSQELLEDIGAVDEQAEVLSNLCRVYAQLDQRDLAMNCGLRSASLYRQASNPLGQAHVMVSIGDLYRSIQRYTRFPPFAAGSGQRDPMPDASVSPMVRQHTQVMDWGIPNNALDCYHASLDVARQVGAKFDMVVALLRLGDTYLYDPVPALTTADRLDQAMGYLQMALELAQEINARSLVFESHHFLSQTFKQMGDFESALLHYEKYHLVRDEVFSRESENRMRNLEIVHQVDVARKQAELSRLKNITLQHEIEVREEAQRELEAINQQLQEEITAREQLIGDLNAFSHMVAHDLKNPLTNISIAVGLVKLELNRLSGEAVDNESLDRIVWMVGKMNRIINELLTLASVREEAVYAEPLDTAKIVQETERRLNHLVQETGASITKPDSWPEALGHAPWVEEIWANYLSNAIVYGGSPPRIELGADELEPVFDLSQVAATSDEEDLVLPAGMIRFWVRDHGDGIDLDLQASIFQPFNYRQNNEPDLPRRGHGLGLSIVKRIVEKLGGSVGVESSGKPGEGSLFYFTLPAAPPRFFD